MWNAQPDLSFKCMVFVKTTLGILCWKAVVFHATFMHCDWMSLLIPQCHCVGLGFENQFLWSLDCMWGKHVGCQGPLVHALFSAIGGIVCKSYGRGDKAPYFWCVNVSNLPIHMSFLISASRFGSVEGGTGRWWLEERRIICQVSNALTDWCLISHAVCIHPPPFSLSVPKPCLPTGMSFIIGDWFETLHATDLISVACSSQVPDLKIHLKQFFFALSFF